ncbi:hypothetical protein DPEC_G00060130 [Dallia pectoralis]|uniref:Uncharacterized protein n=1 Tax=Dallia pectoralis TaxID=75939 RepID=A0ACC2H6Y0_DALPE|nr:hypothetical protein DPEC_G00060130 [Dallia pectoralis]
MGGAGTFCQRSGLCSNRFRFSPPSLATGTRKVKTGDNRLTRRRAVGQEAHGAVRITYWFLIADYSIRLIADSFGASGSVLNTCTEALRSASLWIALHLFVLSEFHLETLTDLAGRLQTPL